MEPSPGLEPGTSFVPGRALAAGATKACSGGRKPLPGVDTRLVPVQEAPGPGPRGPCARRESNPQHPPPQDGLSASWSTSTQSRYTESNRAMRRTKAQSHRAHRQSWGTRARTWSLLGQNQMCCPITPFPIGIRLRSVQPSRPSVPPIRLGAPYGFGGS
jgi:hypothetical protein